MLFNINAGRFLRCVVWFGFGFRFKYEVVYVPGTWLRLIYTRPFRFVSFRFVSFRFVTFQFRFVSLGPVLCCPWFVLHVLYCLALACLESKLFRPILSYLTVRLTQGGRERAREGGRREGNGPRFSLPFIGMKHNCASSLELQADRHTDRQMYRQTDTIIGQPTDRARPNGYAHLFVRVGVSGEDPVTFRSRGGDYRDGSICMLLHETLEFVFCAMLEGRKFGDRRQEEWTDVLQIRRNTLWCAFRKRGRAMHACTKSLPVCFWIQGRSRKTVKHTDR